MTLAPPENVPIPARTRVLREVRALLASGKYRPGENFLSERSLAEELAVGRGVVRSAIAELRQEGLLQQSAGRSLKVAGRQLEAGLLSEAVVVLSPTPRPQPGHAAQGWAEYIAQGAVNELRVSGRPAVIMDPERCVGTVLEAMLRDPPAGVILPEIPDSPTLPIDLMHMLAASNIALVVYGGSPELARFDRVRSDHEAGCYALTRHLIATGSRRIMCLWPSDWKLTYWAVGRRNGYERALQEAGLECLPVHEYGSITIDRSHADHSRRVAVDRDTDPELFKARVQFMAGCLLPVMHGATAPDAILVLSDGHVPSLASALRLFGKLPGKHVRIGGYDNYWRENPAQVFESAPPTVTVDKRNRAMGEEMVKLLQERLAGSVTHAPQDRIVRPELLIT